MGNHYATHRLRSALAVLYAEVLLLATNASAAPCGDACKLDNPNTLGIPQVGVSNVFTGVIDIMSFFAGVLSAIFIVVAGIRYASSSGNAKRTEAAKQTLTYAVLGLIISILAPVIVGFIAAKSP